jgi:hypothetical protein
MVEHTVDAVISSAAPARPAPRSGVFDRKSAVFPSASPAATGTKRTRSPGAMSIAGSRAGLKSSTPIARAIKFHPPGERDG